MKSVIIHLYDKDGVEFILTAEVASVAIQRGSNGAPVVPVTAEWLDSMEEMGLSWIED